jgi:preprotein translocase subunit SecG
MPLFLNLIVALQILTALVMIGLVLIQHGKGADMGASFGSGASGSLFGATGSANFLSRSTAVCAALFFSSTLAASAASAPAQGAARIPGAAPAAEVPVPTVAASGASAIPTK